MEADNTIFSQQEGDRNQLQDHMAISRSDFHLTNIHRNRQILLPTQSQ